MKKYKLSEIVLDFELYPRGSIDSHHVGEISSAIDAGASMPPLVIDIKSKRIVDGFHRWKAYVRLFGEDHKIQCIEKKYADDNALFLDTMRYNSSHGRSLTQHDKAHCLILAERFKIKTELVCDALHITQERFNGLQTQRIGNLQAQPIALKRTISHMAGKSLTKKQSEANNKLSGMNQMFYANQLITLIESDLIDMENAQLLLTLGKLADLIRPVIRRIA